jgi:hypothetical protein
MSLNKQYLVDETYFHVGSGACRDRNDDVMVEIFAGLPIHVGIRNLMAMLEKYDFMNPAEMLYAMGRYEPLLCYYKVKMIRKCGVVLILESI